MKVNHIIKTASFILGIAVFAMFVACSGKKSKKRNDDPIIGKYVYMDSEDILHVRSTCYGTSVANSEGSLYTKPISFVDTAILNYSHLDRLCPDCVRDEHYAELERIAKSHVFYADTIDWSEYEVK
jgi:hypothetical protein